MPDKQSVQAADTQLDSLVPAIRHITFHSARDPTAANEIAGNGYARRTVANGGWTKSTVGGFRRLANTLAINYPSPAGGAWATNGGCIACWTDVPSQPGAQWLWYVELTDAIADGATVQIGAGQFGYEIKLEE